MSEQSTRILCYNYGVDCMNNAVGEFDFADGKGIKMYCRDCVESNCDIYNEDEYETDESLIFCNTEWEAQG